MKLVLFAFMLLIQNPPAIEVKEWSWLASAFAPCENVGVHGAYRVTVKADTLTRRDGKLSVTRMTAKATSAIFSQGNNEFSISVAVLTGASEGGSIPFTPQPPKSIGPAPGPNESRMRFLPTGQTLLVPPGSKLRFRVAASVRLEGGRCALGSDTEDIDPFH